MAQICGSSVDSTEIGNQPGDGSGMRDQPGWLRNVGSAWMAQDCGTHCPPAGPCLDGPEQDPEPGAAPGAALERSQIPAAPAGQAQPCREQRRGLGNPGGRNEGIIEVTGTVLLRAQREPGEPQTPARLQDRHKFKEKGIQMKLMDLEQSYSIVT